MIGATTSQTLDLTLKNKGDMIYGTSTIKVEIGLKVGSTIEYIPMGIYNIDDIEKTDYTIKITAFDNMIKFERNFSTNLGENLTLQQVVSELERITGVQFTGSLPSYTVKKLEGFTCREILGYVASLCGGNAVITREGKFTIVTPNDINYSINTSNYFDYKREETKYKIGKISCQVGEEVLSKGSLGTDSMELQFENPWVTNSILQDIYNKLNGFEYLGYSMKWQGDLSLDLGDIVTITDKKGVVRKHPILSQKFNYTGGLTSEISAKGENKNKNEFSSSGSTAKKVERVVMELALINKALIDVAYIGDLTAGNIKFNVGSGGTLDLQTLLSKFVTGENGQFLNITSSNTTIANAVIKDAMIDTVNASKINAGTINSNLVEIKGSNGNLSIKDNTIQIKDNNRVRVQIGKDANNDYSMYVWDSNGKLMFDATGLKADGIKDKIIRDDMVADNANINGSKINISSLISEFNKDTNTNLLKASKVAFDSTGQSLEVSFNSLKSTADDTKSKTESNTTSINAINGQIDTLISNTSIIEGDITILNNNYSSLSQTVNGINTTVASHTTSIGSLTTDLDTVSGKVTTVENKQATLEQNLEGFKTTVSNTYSTKTELNNLSGTVSSINSRVSTAESSISQLNNKIALKVEATEVNNIVNTAVNGIKINVRNLVIRSNELKNKLIDGNGNISNGTGCAVMFEYISVSSGEVLTFSKTNSVGSDGYWRWKWLDAEGKYISRQADKRNEFQWTVPSGAYFIQVSYPMDAFPKIERGNKPTGWSPAPEDIDNSISAVDTKVTTVNNKVATIETSLNSITSRVSSTENSITTINGNISSLQTRMSTAEQKITDSAIINTVSSTFLKKTDATATYATISSLTQTENSLIASFKANGGYNLLRNGALKNGSSYWSKREYNLVGSNLTRLFNVRKDSWTGNESALQLQINNMTSGEFGFYQDFPTTIGKKYVFTCYLAGHRSNKRVIIRGASDSSSGWLANKTYGAIHGGANLSDWVKVVVPFTAERTWTSVEIHITSTIGSDGYVWAKELMISEGDDWKPFSPNPSEIYEGSTIIDASGVTIENGALKVKNNAGQVVLSGDSDGNLLVQNSLTVGGNTNGNIQVKNAYNVNIFSANKNGIFIKDGVMKITSGNVVWNGINYPEGDKKEMIVFANGINMYETQYMGSQEYIYQGYHYANKLILIEDNRYNNHQTYYETNITARRITTPSMTLGDSNKGNSGYTTLPNGLILQWGNNSGLQSGWGTYFPISFPNACLAVIPICTTHQIAVRVTSKSRDSFACNFGSTTGVGINFIAIGY